MRFLTPPALCPAIAAALPTPVGALTPALFLAARSRWNSFLSSRAISSVSLGCWGWPVLKDDGAGGCESR